MKKIIFILATISTMTYANNQTNTSEIKSNQVKQEQESREQKIFQKGIDFAEKNKKEIVNKEVVKDGEALAKEMCKQYPIACIENKSQQ